MSMFVRVVADSICPRGIRLTTFHLHYWRAIHSELMTHRDFGRNARSSRAVPSRVLLTEPIFIPRFGMDKPGMQSDILAAPELQEKWSEEWEELAQICREYVGRWSKEGMHKQHANRPLEWFGWIDVQVTSVYWENFWALRISDYAQPEFNELAHAMRAEMQLSDPQLLMPGEWHLPWIRSEDYKATLDRAISGTGGTDALEELRKISVARSARLSYKPFDGNGDFDAEMARYDKLMISRPVHASPAEHQATPDVWQEARSFIPAGYANPKLHGNLYGWIQHRKTVPHENVREDWS